MEGNEMQEVRQPRLGRFYKRWATEIVTTEVYHRGLTIDGGIVMIEDCFGKRYLESKGFGGFDDCVQLASSCVRRK